MFICLLAIIIAVAGSVGVWVLLRDKNVQPPRQTNAEIERIGIGGGGAFFNPMIDPTNKDIYYVTSDMGALYYSYNQGASWKRTEARGVFTQTHIAQNGVVFAGELACRN